MWPPPLSQTPLEFEVKSRIDGKRIDSYLASRFTDYSRQVLQKVIDAEGVRVNGRTVKASYRVRSGDMISIHLPELPEVSPQPEDLPIEVVYEDEHLAVVNKPAGMVTHRARKLARVRWSTRFNFISTGCRRLPEKNGRESSTASTGTQLVSWSSPRTSTSTIASLIRFKHAVCRKNTWPWSTAFRSATVITSSSRSAFTPFPVRRWPFAQPPTAANRP